MFFLLALLGIYGGMFALPFVPFLFAQPSKPGHYVLESERRMLQAYQSYSQEFRQQQEPMEYEEFRAMQEGMLYIPHDDTALEPSPSVW